MHNTYNSLFVSALILQEFEFYLRKEALFTLKRFHLLGKKAGKLRNRF